MVKTIEDIICYLKHDMQLWLKYLLWEIETAQ